MIDPAQGSELGAVFLAYVLGCICGGYYLVRLTTGEDLRLLGSGSLGSTNAARRLGRWAFPLVLVFDLGKGALAVWAADRLGAADAVLAIVAGVVVLGHVFPIQLGFRGGKGVATSVGAWAVLAPWTLGVLVAASLPVILLRRRLVPGGMMGYAVVAIAAWPLAESSVIALSIALTAALVIVAHRDNLRRDLSLGKEEDHREP
jgi:glycerol-3-phosphate acyltransferase PlsY